MHKYEIFLKNILKKQMVKLQMGNQCFEKNTRLRPHITLKLFFSLMSFNYFFNICHFDSY